MTIEAICKRVCGLDVHKKIIVGTILLEDATGQLTEETREFGTLPSELTKLTDWLTAHKIELTVMESTGVFWKPVYAALEEQRLKAAVVNARHIKNVPGRKTDVKDSQWIASLARCGLLKGSFIPDKVLRDLRMLTRYRIKLQRMVAQEKNRLHKILDAAGFCIGTIVSQITGMSAQAIINGLIKGETVESILVQMKGVVKKKEKQILEILAKPLGQKDRFLLQQILNHILYMEQERTLLDEQILMALEPFKEFWNILQTIPGIDKWSAAYLIAECGTDMKRFGRMDEFCAWAGMCPGNNESAGKSKSGRRRKGNPFLGFVLCEIANAAIKTKSQFNAKYKTLAIRRGHKRAVIAIGHKILRVMYRLFTTKEHYKDPGIDYQKLVVERNAPRWMKELQKYGFQGEQKRAYNRKANKQDP